MYDIFFSYPYREIHPVFQIRMKLLKSSIHNSFVQSIEKRIIISAPCTKVKRLAQQLVFLSIFLTENCIILKSISVIALCSVYIEVLLESNSTPSFPATLFSTFSNRVAVFPFLTNPVFPMKITTWKTSLFHSTF